jgi:hypothetical protein
MSLLFCVFASICVITYYPAVEQMIVSELVSVHTCVVARLRNLSSVAVSRQLISLASLHDQSEIASDDLRD